MHEDNRLLVASNFSGAVQAVSLAPLPSVWHCEAFTDVLNDWPVVFSSGRLVLPPYGYWWLQPDDEAPGDLVTTPLEIEVHTEWGEQVYLCGTLEVLGAGDPRDALGPLSADDYPKWRTEIDVPARTYVEFRWIKKRDGRVVEWSPHSYAATGGTASSGAWRSLANALVGPSGGVRYSKMIPTASPMPTASATRSLPLTVPAGRDAS